MTGMLASVSNIEEALVVLTEQVDIIDLKNPAAGSLGRLPIEDIARIVDLIDGQCLVSATIGDLPMDKQLIFDAVKEVADTRVNFVKIGLNTDESAKHVIEYLAQLTPQTKLIAVLFADQNPDFRVLDRLNSSGFSGVMLDTFNKSQGSITELMSQAEIQSFVNLAQSKHLLSGLAGSLKSADIPVLMSLKADYLGFRSALCCQQERTHSIQASHLKKIKQIMFDYGL